MRLIKKFTTIIIVLFTFTHLSQAQEQIVYLNLDSVVNNTQAGKSIIAKLENSKKTALQKFEKKEKDLKKIENEINKQKNIISEDELKKKLFEFRKKVTNKCFEYPIRVVTLKIKKKFIKKMINKSLLFSKFINL